jgi:hypothetical protein
MAQRQRRPRQRGPRRRCSSPPKQRLLLSSAACESVSPSRHASPPPPLPGPGRGLRLRLLPGRAVEPLAPFSTSHLAAPPPAVGVALAGPSRANCRGAGVNAGDMLTAAAAAAARPQELQERDLQLQQQHAAPAPCIRSSQAGCPLTRSHHGADTMFCCGSSQDRVVLRWAKAAIPAESHPSLPSRSPSPFGSFYGAEKPDKASRTRRRGGWHARAARK